MNAIMEQCERLSRQLSRIMHPDCPPEATGLRDESVFKERYREIAFALAEQGLVIVPLEMTDKMFEARDLALREGESARIWKHMIAAYTTEQGDRS